MHLSLGSIENTEIFYYKGFAKRSVYQVEVVEVDAVASENGEIDPILTGVSNRPDA